MNERLELVDQRIEQLKKAITEYENTHDPQSASSSEIINFDIKNYKDKTFDEMIHDYCIFHKQMINGLIPPKYLYLEIGSNVGGGTYSIPTYP